MSIFDEVHDRRKTRSVKWDMLQPIFQSEDVIPMWVADMDFKAPDAVNNALVKRAEHGIYGYTIIDNDVTDSIVNWQKNQHGWEINSEWLSFSPGVVTSLHMAIQAFTEPNDMVLIQTPVYPPFYNVIKAHDREIIKSPLLYQDNYYTIDFVDFEEKLKSGVKAFILCSPHNPVGRVWTENELKEMARLCLKYDVLIISDEIHADLVFLSKHHIPIASLSEEIADRTITCMAPSKTFNLAGLEASYTIVTNEQMRNKLKAQFSKQGYSNSLNTMANTAIEAAYNHGKAWLDELVSVLNNHQQYVTEMFRQHTPEIKVTQGEGTYLLWIDCSALGMSSKELKQFFIEKAKVGLNAGVDYGDEADQFMRMNIACPKATLVDGVNQIIEAVQKR
ncbi:cystathionine beta-lyase [Oceanobacillus zhaokaii]|uniref:cysteine-S-conjugate beta-lyase n=1 Tax=Oceanobacillus zhaokaii TaxID=2052660 RepID=A0A345PIL5_9BACI|nr:MalY/PatB family protein [Oceanobacillus zhaokaii]AXI09845.1 cystathionine beta-lyase [Oceanobacillus zhaokaii]